MDDKKRNELLKNLFSHCEAMMNKKGKSYAGSEDVLANFKRNAELLGMTPFQVWAVYFNKHVDSINNAIKENPEYPIDRSEDIKGRIIDSISYLTLFDCLLVEFHDAPKKGKLSIELDKLDKLDECI